jgi:hypothetical protein
MRYFLVITFLLVLAAGCKRKILSGAKLEAKLIETMQDYLDKQARPGVEFTVKDVSYYPEKKEQVYKCAFHVNMHTANKDSLGIMTAIIPNDFSKVDRRQ